MRSLLGMLTMLTGVGSPQTVYADTTDFVIVDVRTAEEFNDGHVKGSLNIDIMDESFRGKISKLDKSKIYKLYCRSGNRSGQAERFMKSIGFKDVENLGSLKQAANRLIRAIEGR